MVMDLHEYNGTNYISARDLHKQLGIKHQFSGWISKAIKNAMLDQADFYRHVGKSTGGRKPVDYMLTRDAAISVAVVSRSSNAKAIREHIIDLYKQHEAGKAYTQEQWLALIDITKAMVLVSIQDDVNRKHYKLYGNKYSWWKYKANLLGYTTNELKAAMAKVNRTYQNRRHALLKMDAHELIRVGVIDLFKALGKSDEFAQNAGINCKEISKKVNVMTDFFDDTKDNPLGLNAGEVENRKQLFENTDAKKLY